MTPREQHVGYYLIAEGRPALETRIGFHPTPGRAFLRLLWDHPTFAYLGSIVLLVVLVLLGIVALTIQFCTAGTLLAFLLGVLPASAVAIHVVNWLVGLVVPPRRLPKLEWKDGIPPESRAMVVIPALLATEKDVSFLIRQIENHYVGNPDRNLLFALLTDFADAPEQNMPQDEELIVQARIRIDQLNEKYGVAGSVTNAVALLTVWVPPVIVSGPQSATNVVGTTASFDVGANGTAPLSYQSQSNGTNLSGATGSIV